MALFAELAVPLELFAGAGPGPLEGAAPFIFVFAGASVDLLAATLSVALGSLDWVCGVAGQSILAVLLLIAWIPILPLFSIHLHGFRNGVDFIIIGNHA